MIGMNKLVILAALSILLTACGGGANVKPDTASTTSKIGSFEQFADSYAAKNDTGDGTVYKFARYSKVMETYHTTARQSLFINWCVDNNYKITEKGGLALWSKLRELYPKETISDRVLCGDGQGGFYSIVVFNSRNATAFVKAGTLNPKIPLDFWPENNRPQDFWPNKKG
jgi:hypothetical protein